MPQLFWFPSLSIAKTSTSFWSFQYIESQYILPVTVLIYPGTIVTPAIIV